MFKQPTEMDQASIHFLSWKQLYIFHHVLVMKRRGTTNLQTVPWSHSVCSAEACSLCKDRGYDLLPGLDEAYQVCKTIRFQSIIKRKKMFLFFFFERSVFGITHMWIQRCGLVKYQAVQKSVAHPRSLSKQMHYDCLSPKMNPLFY